MGVFKNGVGRPSNETIKKRNIFKGICVLLVLIIIGMTVYILNDKGIINISSKDNKKTVDKKTNKDTTKESEKEEILDVNSDIVVNLFNKMNNFTNDLDLLDVKAEENLYSYFYQSDSLKQEQVDDRIKFAYSFANVYKDIKINYKSEWYDAEKFRKDFVGNVSDVNNESIKIFGSGFDINKVMVNGVGPAIFGEQTMINGDKITIEAAGIGGVQGANIFTKIISSKKKDNKIIIENKVMFVFASENVEQSIFKTAKKHIDNCEGASCLGLVDKVSEISNQDNSLDKIKIDNYLDKLDTYRWTFKENTDGSYTFESVEKVK